MFLLLLWENLISVFSFYQVLWRIPEYLHVHDCWPDYALMYSMWDNSSCSELYRHEHCDTMLWLITVKKMYDLIDHSPSPAELNQTDPGASHVAINLVNRWLLPHFNTCVKLHLLFIYFFVYTCLCVSRSSQASAHDDMWTHTRTQTNKPWLLVNQWQWKLKSKTFWGYFFLSDLSGQILAPRSWRCKRNAQIHTYIHPCTHTHLMGGISVSSNLWYEIFITTFCAQLQCHALCVVPGFDVRLVIRTHTISLTLGVKVFFPRWCPTSSALLPFSISLSVALSLLSLFPLLRSCLSFSSSFALSLLPHLPPPCLLHIKTHKQEQICDLLSAASSV